MVRILEDEGATTLILAHFENNFTDEKGHSGSSSGITYSSSSPLAGTYSAILNSKTDRGYWTLLQQNWGTWEISIKYNNEALGGLFILTNVESTFYQYYRAAVRAGDDDEIIFFIRSVGSLGTFSVYTGNYFEDGVIYNIKFVFGSSGIQCLVNGKPLYSRFDDNFNCDEVPKRHGIGQIGTSSSFNSVGGTYDEYRLSNDLKFEFGHKQNGIYAYKRNGIIREEFKKVNTINRAVIT